MMPLWTLWCEKGIPALIQSRMGKGRTHYNGFIVPKHPGITENDAQLTFKAPCYDTIPTKNGRELVEK